MPALSVPIAILNHDFEAEDNQLEDNAFSTGAIESWAEIGTGGILNPSTDRWYDNTDIDDDGPTGGVIGSMSGPNVGFGVGGSTLSQILSTEVASEGEYLLEVAIGDRNIGNNATQFGGYNLELWDGDSQLATTGDI
ncbi:unnamed protein product, partial [Ectocarpus sp. 4 AP-2014]